MGRRTPRRTPSPEPLGPVLAGLGVGSWDLALVGDGSCDVGDGSVAVSAEGAGWAVALEDASGFCKRLWGAASCLSVAASELMPYVHALEWYFGPHGPGGGNAARLRRPLEVHVVTDSRSVAEIGSGRAGARACRGLWAALRALEKDGRCRLSFHHVPRATLAANVFADAAAKAARRSLSGLPAGE